MPRFAVYYILMSRASFLRLFPTPRYLAMSVAGLDISDQSVKFIKLSLRGEKLMIESYGEKPVPLGAIESGLVRDSEALARVLFELKEEYHLTQIVASMPEEEAYIARLTLPARRESELREAVELQLEEYVPLPPGEAIFDYEVIEPPPTENGKYELVVSALPRRIVTNYTEVFKKTGLQAVAFEVEAHAIARSVMPVGEDRLTMIVDFGKTRTSFFIASGWSVVFTATAKSIGGEDITVAIQKSLNLSRAKAEELKVEQGLLGTHSNRELFFAIIPIISVLRDEITKHQSYWETHRDDHGRLGRRIEEVIICGGQATLPGLVDHLNMSLDVPVVIGNPWQNLFSFEKYIPPINLNQALRYTTAIGLSLRTLAQFT